MSDLIELIRNQGKLLLDNYWRTLLCVLILALIPYMSWVSTVMIALMTLRRGGSAGGLLLICVIIPHFLLSLSSFSVLIAAVNALLSFVPCYLAAYVLRMSASWRAVAGYFFLLAIFVMIFVHFFMPDLVMEQYQYISALIKNRHPQASLLDFIQDKSETQQLIQANYLFGIQATGVVLSAVLSLMLARFVQSQLYYPGGFRREMLDFRGDKMELLLLGVMLFGAYHGHALAINILPMLIFYFLLAGLSLGFNALARTRVLGSFLLLLTPLIFMPLVMLPVYVIFGSLDSVFNFRLYLSNRADKRI